MEIGLAEWPEGEEIPPEGAPLHIRSTILTFRAKKSVPIFTLITRQPLRKWRSQGWRVEHLLDDYAFTDPVHVSAESAGRMRDLQRPGDQGPGEAGLLTELCEVDIDADAAAGRSCW